MCHIKLHDTCVECFAVKTWVISYCTAIFLCSDVCIDITCAIGLIVNLNKTQTEPRIMIQ